MKRMISLALAVLLASFMLVIPAFAIDVKGFTIKDGNSYINKLVIPYSAECEKQLEELNHMITNNSYWCLYSNDSIVFVPSGYVNNNYFLEHYEYRFPWGGNRYTFSLQEDGTYLLDSVLNQRFTTVSYNSWLLPVGSYSSMPSYVKVYREGFVGDIIVPKAEIDNSFTIVQDLAEGLKPYCTGVTVDYTVASDTMDVMKYLEKYISLYSGIADSGVVVSLEDIKVANFTPAIEGTEQSPSGANGSFNYTVTLRKGRATKVLSGLTGSITAKEYVPSPERLAVKSAVAILSDNKTFDFEQKNIADETVLKTSIQNAITSLSGFSDTGVTVVATVEKYTPAVNGDEENETGVDGSYTASVLLSKGEESETVTGVMGTLFSTKYTPPPELPKPPYGGDLSDMMEYFLHMVISSFGVILPSGLLVAGIILSIRMIPKILKRYTTGV